MTDSILIVGAGVAGLTAAKLSVDAGARVLLVDTAPIIGGRLAPLLSEDSPRADDAQAIVGARLGALSAEEHVEIVTLAQLERIEGHPGNFSVSIREHARFVTDACTRCNRCRPVCPSVRPNEFDQGLTYRKAIFTPLPHTVPPEYAIDIDSCLNSPPNYLPCNRCIDVCDDDAIHFDLPMDRLHERQVGAVIMSVGFDTMVDGRLKDCGYGSHPDVLTSAEFERLLMAPGPTGGFAAKPSDEEYPDRVMLILDDLTPFWVNTALRQTRRLADQGVGKITLLLTTQPGPGEAAALKDLPADVEVVAGLLQKVEPGAGPGIGVTYAEFSGMRVPTRNFDLVVLASNVRPADSLPRLAQIVGCDLTDDGYPVLGDTPCTTSQPGVFVAGGIRGPVTLPDALNDAAAAATAALSQLDPRLLRPGFLPAPEQDSAGRLDNLSTDEMRARIERALIALLDK